MKSIFTLLLFVSVALTSFGQTPTYTEFTEQNETIVGGEKWVETGGTIWQITDNNNPSDIRTYLFWQRVSSVPNVPNVPANWNAMEITYDQKTKLPFDFTGPVTYILTEDYAVYIKIN